MTIDTHAFDENIFSSDQIELLTKPTVDLFVTGDNSSTEAVNVLDRAGAWFRVQRSETGHLSAEWKDLDLTFRGLEEIQHLANVLMSLHECSRGSSCETESLQSAGFDENAKIIELRRKKQKTDGEAVVETLRSSDHFAAGH